MQIRAILRVLGLLLMLFSFTVLPPAVIGVRVNTADETFRGSHAVVSVPLGVLKSGDLKFEPALPEAKLQAIDRLQMGDLEKVVMVFGERFWDRWP